MCYIMLSIRKLIHTEPIASIRFWGKIFGTLKNYLVLETEFKEEEMIKRNETAVEATDIPQTTEEGVIKGEEGIAEALSELAKVQELAGEGDTKYPRLLPPEPVIQYEEPPEPPSELCGVGVNKKAYYVCTDMGEPWVQLPELTPKHIRVARQIYKSFTGNLEEPIQTYPEFPGQEKEYLRAQIARISAGTQISPLGFYTFGGADGGEGDEEDEGGEEAAAGGPKTEYTINPKYEAPPLKDLLDGSMSFWVHHAQYILPQGRTTWWNPNPMPELGEGMGGEGGEGEGEEEDQGKGDRIEPETGPPLLTPLSEDAAVEAVPAWSIRCSSNIIDDFAVVVVRSNLWPGAYTFATQGKLFENVYLGFGHKYMEYNFSPLPLTPIQQEYPLGPEIMEMTDPAGAEEEQWRIDHLPKPKPIPPVEEAGAGEGAEEEEEEDEDE